MVNHETLQGRFVEDPTFGDTKGGTRYANFRMAWSEKINDKESKLFIECKAFGGTAQFMEKYMNRKGQEIIAEGKLNTEEWTNQDGQKRSKIALIVSNVHFCGRKQEGGQDAVENAQVPQPVQADDSELPF